MPTTLPRVNVSLDPSLYRALEEVAKSEDASLSHVVSELVKFALELSEDLALAQQAEKRLGTFTRDDALSTSQLLKWNKSRRKGR